MPSNTNLGIVTIYLNSVNLKVLAETGLVLIEQICECKSAAISALEPKCDLQRLVILSAGY